MSGWGTYAAAWALFVFTHAVPVRPPVKPWLVARLGKAGYGIIYSALSLAVLAWLFVAAARAPHVVLWSMPTGAHWIVLTAMLLAMLLLALTLGRPNPFSFGGAGNADFIPEQPEVIRLTRHPVLVALGLWAGAHAVVNGTLAHALMFGGFTAFAILGTVLIDRRKRRMMGVHVWQDLRERTRGARLTLPPKAGLRVTLGLGALVGVIAGHQWLSGVIIWPRFLP
ncbi:NnrU family protein [Roseinatronobacter alkalisoli]|uniref:NnrU family protein n=1 Tax=Roseinatronobacter alkalisoli TaxID=3028235 RepID=A0ABT5TB09_9RHOB|nr:NnrU family protein [Roseinatronobacter sp. HJB301]MDD7972314.1 NnrU family protein [Roseinatronobacter sp. HJB301]